MSLFFFFFLLEKIKRKGADAVTNPFLRNMSRFVSAGAIDAATGEAVGADEQQQGGEAGSSRRQEWSAVSRELDEQRKRREEEARRNAEEGGEPSLFAILQANKGRFSFLLFFQATNAYHPWLFSWQDRH